MGRTSRRRRRAMTPLPEITSITSARGFATSDCPICTSDLLDDALFDGLEQTRRVARIARRSAALEQSRAKDRTQRGRRQVKRPGPGAVLLIGYALLAALAAAAIVAVMLRIARTLPSLW